MKTRILAASAVFLSLPATGFAGGHEGDGAPNGGPPPAVVATINLGGAGLLTSFYANSQKGVTAGRGGRDSSRIGAATASGITTGYEHDTFSFLPSLSGNKMIQQGTSFVTFSVGTNIAEEQPNQTQASIQIPEVSVGYENFSDPNAAWSLGLAYSERTTELQTAPVETGAESTELRFAYVRKLTDNWGIGNQTYVTFGDTYVTTPGGTTTEDEVEVYTQLELVGAFATDQVGFVPEGWKLHPVLGVSSQTVTIEDAAGDTSSLSDGSVWSKVILAKGARPGTWVPAVTLGVEHIYQTDTSDLFIDEENFAILGAGARYLGEGGSFNVNFERRQGFNGNRVTNSLVAGYSFDF